MIGYVNSFCPENTSIVQDISSRSSVHSNLNQHQFSFSKWQMSKIMDLQASPQNFITAWKIMVQTIQHAQDSIHQACTISYRGNKCPTANKQKKTRKDVGKSKDLQFKLHRNS